MNEKLEGKLNQSSVPCGEGVTLLQFANIEMPLSNANYHIEIFVKSFKMPRQIHIARRVVLKGRSCFLSLSARTGCTVTEESVQEK